MARPFSVSEEEGCGDPSAMPLTGHGRQIVHLPSTSTIDTVHPPLVRGIGTNPEGSQRRNLSACSPQQQEERGRKEVFALHLIA